MMRMRSLPLATILAVASLFGIFALARGQAAQNPPTGRPDATVDLATREGAILLKAQWRYSDTKIVEVDYRAPGADLKPTGRPIKTYDYQPKAGAADFDDSRRTLLDLRR